MKKEFQNRSNFTKQLNLWLAEDDDGVRELLAEFFNRSEVKCARQFSSAEEVVSALQQGAAPDLILLDVNMGGMDGIEAIAPIRRLAGGVRVFIMTTFYDNLAIARARNAGAAGFFLKRDDWDAAIARMLDATADWGREAVVSEGEREKTRRMGVGFGLAQTAPA